MQGQVRTLHIHGRRLRILALLSAAAVVFLALCSPAAASSKASERSQRVAINAKAAVVLDAETDKILYSKHADEPMFPASTTKLMTAILLVTHTKPDDPIYVSKEAAREPRVRLGLKAGTQITADEALHAVLMKSANDVAFAVAETVGGSQAGFARMMNMKARLLGCTNTNFVTPNGLHDDNHKTSAHDVALILAEAIKHPDIVKTMQTTNFTVAGKAIRNGNRFMYLKQSPFGDIIGGKTGYTSKAMYCLAFAVKQEEGVRVSVVLGAPRKSLMYRETRRLLQFAQQHRRVTLV
jgi:D-alanyl-D-alanine carboxypeptidase